MESKAWSMVLLKPSKIQKAKESTQEEIADAKSRILSMTIRHNLVV